MSYQNWTHIKYYQHDSFRIAVLLESNSSHLQLYIDKHEKLQKSKRWLLLRMLRLPGKVAEYEEEAFPCKL